MGEILYVYRDKNDHRSYTPSLVTAHRRHVGKSEITFVISSPKKQQKKKSRITKFIKNT